MAARGHVNTRTRGRRVDAATSAARIVPPPRVRSAGSPASLGDFALLLVRPRPDARTAARIPHAALDAASGTARGGAADVARRALRGVRDPCAEDRPGRLRGVPARGPAARRGLGAGAGPAVAPLSHRTLGSLRHAGPGRVSA